MQGAATWSYDNGAEKNAVRQNIALPAEAEQVPHPLELWGLG